MIPKIIQNQSLGIEPMPPVIDTLEVLVDVPTDSIYWYGVYEASRFPMMTWEKPYFILFSSDHDQTLTGGLHWGDSDTPYPNDFRYRGLIRDTYQAETPFPWVFNGKFYLFYHTIHTNPLNVCAGIGQETNIMSATSGVLHTATWTDEPNPFGCQGTVAGISQSHVGYAKLWKIKGNIFCNHHFNGGSPLYFQISTTLDGNTWYHNDPYTNYDVFLPETDKWVMSQAQFFERNGKLWGLVNSANKETNFSGGTEWSGNLHLVKINDRLQITELVHTYTTEPQQAFSISIIGDTAHLYRQTGRPDRPDTFYPYLGYSTIDLKPLDYL